ncbi:MAG: DedA family protein [Actinomycetales bacterium]
MLDFAIKLVETLGIFGAGLFIAIESVVIPLPSEIVLLLSGFNVSTGEFSFLPLWIVTTTGSLVGALILYSLGYGFSRERLTKLVEKFGRFFGIKERDVTKSFAVFEKYGAWTILIGRLFPLVRSLVSIPAGLAKMNLVKFSLLTFIGSSGFNAIWIYVGIQLGDRWREAESWANTLDWTVNFLLMGIIAALLIRAIRNRRSVNPQ